MGAVYRAEHLGLRKRVAVKVLRPELSRDEDLARRFRLEAVAASRIGQENIIDVTDLGHTPDGALFFVMEELEGRSLAALISETGAFPLQRALPILAQLCRALAAAHAQGVVHRDLKPDNVVVVRRDDGADFVKVVDFGISQVEARSCEVRAARPGPVFGTPEYMSPEQGAGTPIDHRADIYAFGVLAYELVTGALPFDGGTAAATMLQHQTRAPEPPRARRRDLPRGLEELILKALAKSPAARQQSMGEVAASLTGVLALRGLPPVYGAASATLHAGRLGTSGRALTLDLGARLEERPRTTRAQGLPSPRRLRGLRRVAAILGAACLAALVSGSALRGARNAQGGRWIASAAPPGAAGPQPFTASHPSSSPGGRLVKERAPSQRAKEPRPRQTGLLRRPRAAHPSSSWR